MGYLRSGTPVVTAASAVSSACAIVLNAGETGVVIFTTYGTGGTGGTPPTTGQYGVSSISGGGTWTLQKRYAFHPVGENNFVVEIWTTGVGAASAASSITVNWNKTDTATAPTVLLTAAYDNVASIGNTSDAGDAGINVPATNVTTSLTLQEADNIIVSGHAYTSASSATAQTIVTGVSRSQGNDAAGNSTDMSLTHLDNTGNAGAISNKTSIAATEHFFGAAIELRLIQRSAVPARGTAMQQRMR